MKRRALVETNASYFAKAASQTASQPASQPASRLRTIPFLQLCINESASDSPIMKAVRQAKDCVFPPPHTNRGNRAWLHNAEEDY